jgi:flagellar basal body-associated protein FliL
MNALLIPILLICGLFLVAAFVVWMVFFSRSGKDAVTEQHLREHRPDRRPT